ncbi:MAG TPA: heavy-metal-associated domain-containing protein [Kofleriaceae bacterium]|nr:heavy-metal-associated domain-containing protein [Kofleriaceae bacterium]
MRNAVPKQNQRASGEARASTAALSLLLLVAIAGCDKHQPAPAAQKKIAATTQAASPVAAPAPVKVMEATAGAESGGTCGGSMESCSGGCDQFDAEAAEVAKRVVPENATWKTIRVSGMTCGGCERRIIANLGKLDGVIAVEADAELGEVRVAMNHDTDLRAAAVERINSLGYTAK